ncbi:hypothetical protein J3B02_002243 [Coemansia erecta]|uniref:MTOR-associated protein MEAK7 n=1 Tax=Coemansia asiatica TaxID=1052880 RepID=A0A9W7XHM6_9FUNG|nr:hypothetical protein LPJ64_005174 [Coemansia asiatica]KAJ2855299.1 hypothetical protein J3B02_002243 [Coemansia erecta]KAJ2885072.1 hypothetical protein FB639_001847 [Coemansia asiatica]
MGNTSSLVSEAKFKQLSIDNKKAIQRLAQEFDNSRPAADQKGNSNLPFENILSRYIFTNNNDSADIAGAGAETPENRLSHLLYADRHAQTKSVLSLWAASGTQEIKEKQQPFSLYQFVLATCRQAIAGFWQLSAADKLDVEAEWLARKCLLESKQAVKRINGVATDTESFLADDVGEDWQRVARKWLRDAETAGYVSDDAWLIWWGNSSMFRELLNMALSSVIDRTFYREIIRGTRLLMAQRPEITKPRDYISSFSSNDCQSSTFLLCPTTAWVLGRELPKQSQISWQCVYSSRADGRSWSTFQNRIERKGAILVLIRETRRSETVAEPRVFGAYFDYDIEREPGWAGNSLNFLFTCSRDREDMLDGLEIFRSSGFNDHFQYFNYGTKTLPNGLGAGGQLGHFGLWIDSGFVTGSSDAAATFESRQLSSLRDFEIDAIEAWLVRPTERLDEDDTAGAQKSAMETNPEAAALLELANRKMYSKTVPDQDVDRE